MQNMSCEFEDTRVDIMLDQQQGAILGPLLECLGHSTFDGGVVLAGIPISRVGFLSDNMVVQGIHVRHAMFVALDVGRSHVRWVLADDVC